MMDREEFFEKIEDMGFHIEYDQFFLYVLDKDNFLLASISTFYKYQFLFHNVGLMDKGDSNISSFINLVTEFVFSGAERREKKRDCLKGLCSDRCDNRPERADLSYANLSDVDLDDLISRKRIRYKLGKSTMPKEYRDFCLRVIDDERLTPTVKLDQLMPTCGKELGGNDEVQRSDSVSVKKDHKRFRLRSVRVRMGK